MNRLKPRQRVYVTLDTGRTYEGVLLRAGRRWVRLANVRVEHEGGGFTDAPGTGWLPSRRVEFIQVRPA